MDNEDEIVSGEWLDWYRLSPADRWKQLLALWQYFVNMGGSLDDAPDIESPFHDVSQFSPESETLD